MLSTYNRRGGSAALQGLETLPFTQTERWTGLDALIVSFHISASVQRFLRFWNPGALCLLRAITVCAALRTLGLPVQVVIGRRVVHVQRQSIGQQTTEYHFHAWAEIDGTVLTDRPVQKMGHLEIVRVPKAQGREDAAV